jgi:predicted SAM-dependent methyltransferase
MNNQYTKTNVKLDYKKYQSFMYTGMNGILMNINHYILEFGITKDHNQHILEIGGGTNPHYKWIKTNFETYTICDVENNNTTLPENVKFIPAKELIECEHQNKFTRIIASHVLEHLPDPEAQLLSWCSMLCDEGILSIALPCDPGLFWHFCRKISYPKAKQIYGISRKERNLIMSREHINSIYNLKYIIDHYFYKKRILWFPAIIPINNLNLLCVIQLKKKHYIDFDRSNLGDALSNA